MTHITGAGPWRRDGRPGPRSRRAGGPLGRSRRSDRGRQGAAKAQTGMTGVDLTVITAIGGGNAPTVAAETALTLDL